MRPPARILSASSVVVSIVKPQEPVVGRKAQLSGVRVERAQPLELLVSEKVPDIISQVDPRRGLPAIVAGIIGGRDVMHVRDPFFARALQRPDTVARDGLLPSRPARTYARPPPQCRPFPPHLS